MSGLSFLDLKASREKSFAVLTDALNKQTSQKFEDDARFWYPAVDKAGNGYAVIRFLPSLALDKPGFVTTWSHSFKGPTGSWYIERSLTTIGKTDPVSEFNTKLWNSGKDDDKAIARKQKRKLIFISNVLVIRDPANPENEGKVFLYRYGKKIMDKINNLANPSFPEEPKVNIFDLWEGAHLRLKIVTKDDFRNYDASEFSPRSPLHDDEVIMEAIWRKQYPLDEFIDPEKFKSYDELKTRFYTVLGLTGKNGMSEAVAAAREGEDNPPFDPDPPEDGDDPAHSAKMKALFQKLADKE